MENPISIKNLFSPDFETNKTYNISTEFQIIKMNKQDTKNLTHGELYTLTLSDDEYSYSKFIYCKTNSSPDIEVGKYINIIRICPMLLEAHKEKAFLIKELSVLKKDSLNIIKSPPYTENKNNNIYNTISNIEKENPDYNYKSDDKVYTSLKLLTTLSKDYKLLVKVTSKGEIKQYRSGKGKLFSFVIMDELGNKMQAVGFDKIADKFKDEIVENNIYEITGGYIRTADKRFDPPGSDYKLILTESTTITKKDDEEKNFKDKFTDPDNKFWNINEIKEAQINTIVNVVCLVGDKGEPTYKDTKSGSILIRKMFVLDQSNEKMELTLWRNLTQLNMNNGDILVCKKVRVNDFGGKNLTSTTESKIYINPIISDFPEIAKEIQSLKLFAEQNEINKGINPQSDNNNNDNNIKKNESSKANIASNKPEINNSNINNNNTIQKKEFNDKIVYIDSILDEMNKYALTDFDHRFPFYKIRATVTHLGHTEKNFYPGCPNRECNRKLTFSNGDWICQSCRQSFKTPRYYYSLNIRVKDCSSEYWVDIFGKPAEMIMNINADDYRNILVNRDEEKLGQISEGVEYKEFYFLLKVRLNKYNDTTKKKFTATKIERINKKESTGKLMNDLKMKLGI
jgi:replication factor A1